MVGRVAGETGRFVGYVHPQIDPLIYTVCQGCTAYNAAARMTYFQRDSLTFGSSEKWMSGILDLRACFGYFVDASGDDNDDK